MCQFQIEPKDQNSDKIYRNALLSVPQKINYLPSLTQPQGTNYLSWLSMADISQPVWKPGTDTQNRLVRLYMVLMETHTEESPVHTILSYIYPDGIGVLSLITRKLMFTILLAVP